MFLQQKSNQQNFKEQMLVGRNQEDMNRWRAEMFSYQKEKRTKKPFGKELPQVKIIKSAHMQQKDRHFDPIAQQFRNKELQKRILQKQQKRQHLSMSNYTKNLKKHQKDYDIVNLHPYNQQEDKYFRSSPKPNKNPIRYLFNIINNQSLPPQYYENRPVRNVDKPDNKRTFQHVPGESDPNFDYVKGIYRENNQQKNRRQRQAEKHRILQRYQKQKTFDKIYGRYYNPEEEQKHKEELKISQINHGKDYVKRFPPSYVHRQPYIQDLTKPLPQEVLEFDQHQKNAKKRFQMKYLIEEEYKRRNDQDFQKYQSIIKNKIHGGKVLQSLSREHNIINNKFLQMNKSTDFKNPYNYDFLKNSKNQTQKKKQYNYNQSQSDARSQRSYRSDNLEQQVNQRQKSFRNYIKSGGFQ